MGNYPTKILSKFSVNKEVKSQDIRFLSVTIDVLHTGLNLNGSVFEKDIVNQCIDSIKNTAVLGFIRYIPSKDELDFKGHEYILTKNENGVEEKYCGSAYGVIPESCNPRWITKMCSDNVERDFLQVDALLWTKFEDSVGIIERDTSKSQSMELEISSIDGFEDDDGNFHFTKFQFNGCCILGGDCAPAMIDANVTKSEVMFTVSDFVKEIQSELNDKYTEFTQVMTDFENKKKEESNESEPQNNNGEGGNDDMATDFSQTVMQQFSDISKIVSEYATMKDYWGDDVPRYYLADIQDNEVIIVDRQNGYQYYGCEFSMDGDKPVVNFESAKRKKITYADYVEGETAPEGAFDFGTHISDIEDTAFAKVSEAEKSVESANEAKGEAETNYANVKAELDEIKPKYEAYEKAESDRIAAETKKAKENVIAQYEVALKDEEKFVELKGKLDEYATADDVEAKCAVMFARKNIATNFSAGNKKDSTVLGAGTGEDGTPDGYVQTVYGLVRTGR